MPRSKYGNRKVEADGFTFDSRGEYLRYLVLRDMSERGDIYSLGIHPSYDLQDAFVHRGKKIAAITYEPDFTYFEDGRLIAEDFKGVETAVFKIKAKMFKKRYGEQIELRIVR